MAGTDDWMTQLGTPQTQAPTGFNWQSYVAANQDLGQAGIDTEQEALRHYMNFGVKENRNLGTTASAGPTPTAVAGPVPSATTGPAPSASTGPAPSATTGPAPSSGTTQYSAEQQRQIASIWNDPNVSIDDKASWMRQNGMTSNQLASILQSTGQAYTTDPSTLGKAVEIALGKSKGYQYGEFGNKLGIVDLYGIGAYRPMTAEQFAAEQAKNAANAAYAKSVGLTAGPFTMVGGGAGGGAGSGGAGGTVGTGGSSAAGTGSTYTGNAAGTQGPAIWSLSPEQTIQGRLQSLLDPNNPLMQQARTQGLQIANDRGLINSSIAQSAAQNSMYDAALKIAGPDAAIAATAAQANMAAANQFARDNNLQLNDLQKMQLAQTFDLARMDAQQKNQLALQLQQGGVQKDIQDNAATNSRSLQFTSGVSAITTQLSQQIQSILANPNFTDPEAKKRMIEYAKQTAAVSVKTLASAAGDIDATSYIDTIMALGDDGSTNKS